MNHLTLVMEEFGMSDSTIIAVGKIWEVGGASAVVAWAKQFHTSELQRVRKEYHGTERMLAIEAVDFMYARIDYAILQDSTQKIYLN